MHFVIQSPFSSVDELTRGTPKSLLKQTNLGGGGGDILATERHWEVILLCKKEKRG